MNIFTFEIERRQEGQVLAAIKASRFRRVKQVPAAVEPIPRHTSPLAFETLSAASREVFPCRGD